MFQPTVRASRGPRLNTALGATIMRMVVVALATLSISACLPIYVPKRVSAPLDQQQAELDSKKRLEVGDKVTVYTRKKRTEQFEVTRLEPDGFLGVAWDKKEYRVKYTELEKMWVTRWGWDVLDLTRGLH